MDYQVTVAKLMLLHSASLPLQGDLQDQTKEFIEVGEYGFALEWIAGAYLESHTTMPAELFAVFEELAECMKLDLDPVYRSIAEMRKKQAV